MAPEPLPCTPGTQALRERAARADGRTAGLAATNAQLARAVDSLRAHNGSLAAALEASSGELLALRAAVRLSRQHSGAGVVAAQTRALREDQSAALSILRALLAHLLPPEAAPAAAARAVGIAVQPRGRAQYS